MKRRLLFVIFLCASLIPLQAEAEFKVPDSRETQQWKVELLPPSEGEDLIQEEKGKHEVYSVLITNIGENTYNVNVGAFRNEPGTSKMYGLIPQMDTDLLEKGSAFRFTNFPVKAGTDKLEFVITWKEEPTVLSNGKKTPGRKYQETIIFHPKD